MATHRLRDNPRCIHVLTAILDRHSLKAPSHHNPAHYCNLTATNALAKCDRRHAERLDRVRHLIAHGSRTVPSPTTPLPTPVNDVTRAPGTDAKMTVLAFVAAVEPGNEWAGEAGWVRVPVLDLAEVAGVHRQTTWRAIRELQAEGRIETRVHRRLHDGQHRTDRWARLVRP